MSDMREIWRRKSVSELRAAVQDMASFTREAQSVISAEIERRMSDESWWRDASDDDLARESTGNSEVERRLASEEIERRLRDDEHWASMHDVELARLRAGGARLLTKQRRRLEAEALRRDGQALEQDRFVAHLATTARNKRATAIERDAAAVMLRDMGFSQAPVRFPVTAAACGAYAMFAVAALSLFLAFKAPPKTADYVFAYAMSFGREVSYPSATTDGTIGRMFLFVAAAAAWMHANVLLRRARESALKDAQSAPRDRE